MVIDLRMRLRPISLALLLALAFGVMTAAYPCAVVPQRPSPAAMSSSCHDGTAHRPAASASPGKHAKPRGCCDPTGGDPGVCQRACQAIAVLVRPAALGALEGRPDVASPATERSLPLFAISIDHIPLA